MLSVPFVLLTVFGGLSHSLEVGAYLMAGHVLAMPLNVIVQHALVSIELRTFLWTGPPLIITLLSLVPLLCAGKALWFGFSNRDKC